MSEREGRREGVSATKNQAEKQNFFLFSKEEEPAKEEKLKPVGSSSFPVFSFPSFCQKERSRQSVLFMKTDRQWEAHTHTHVLIFLFDATVRLQSCLPVSSRSLKLYCRCSHLLQVTWRTRGERRDDDSKEKRGWNLTRVTLEEGEWEFEKCTHRQRCVYCVLCVSHRRRVSLLPLACLRTVCESLSPSHLTRTSHVGGWWRKKKHQQE